jgi:nucleotide-binding universal stress UspA family protein
VSQEEDIMQTILVPLDGSTLAERALPYAGALARATGGQLALVGAALPSRETTEQGKTQLEQVAGRLRASGLAAFAHVYVAPADEAILDASRQEHAGFIVMSTHGRFGLDRWLYGSVADAVLRRADVPVLVVPATCAGMWPEDRAPRILIALDGSSLAEEVLAPVGALAAALGAELHLLCVVEPPVVTAEPGLYAHLFDPETELAGARTYLRTIAGGSWTAGRPVTVQVDVGPPVSVLVDYAREQQMDLIAMATHGRGGLARLLLGSVASGVLQCAGTPLLLVRPTRVREPAPTPASTVLI